MIHIAQEAEVSPEKVSEAPTDTVVSRLDEALAARRMVLKYAPENE